jgi:ureidoacrylate peracid hydrolase
MAAAPPIIRTGANEANAVTLPARPEALRLDPVETAVVVIDMQNAYASPGGYVDTAGFDIAGSAATIA